MKFLIVLSAFAAVAFAKPGHLLAPAVAYAHVVPGAPLGVDGRVVDTAEVAYAKAEHAAAHINEKHNLAQEAVRSADVVLAHAAPIAHVAHVAHAPVAHVAHVAHAPVAHVAHVAHAAPLAHVAPVAAYPAVHQVYPAGHAAVHQVYPAGHAAVVGVNGHLLDTPEVAHAKAVHAAAHLQEKINHANAAAHSLW